MADTLHYTLPQAAVMPTCFTCPAFAALARPSSSIPRAHLFAQTLRQMQADHKPRVCKADAQEAGGGTQHQPEGGVLACGAHQHVPLSTHSGLRPSNCNPHEPHLHLLSQIAPWLLQASTAGQHQLATCLSDAYTMSWPRISAQPALLSAQSLQSAPRPCSTTLPALHARPDNAPLHRQHLSQLNSSRLPPGHRALCPRWMPDPPHNHPRPRTPDP